MRMKIYCFLKKGGAGLIIFIISAILFSLYVPYSLDNPAFRRKAIAEKDTILAGALPKTVFGWINEPEKINLNLATQYSMYKVFKGEKKPFEDKYVKGYREFIDTTGGRHEEFRVYSVVKPIYVMCTREINIPRLLLNYLLALLIGAFVHVVLLLKILKTKMARENI